MIYLHITLQIFKPTPQHLYISLPPNIIVLQRVQPLDGHHFVLVILHTLVELILDHLLLLLVYFLVLLSDLFFELFLLFLKLKLLFLQLFDLEKLLCYLRCLNSI